MADDNENKYDKLAQSIQDARKSIEDNGNIPPKKHEKEDGGKPNSAGAEFLASIIAGWLLGYGIDWIFGTKPWAMIIFMLLGFISGVYRADKAMKNSNE